MSGRRPWPASVLVACVAAIVSTRASDVAAQTLQFTQVGTIPGPADLIQVDGERAYVAAGHTFTIIDISNPAAPKRGGTHTFPERIWGFRVVGSTAYVAADFYGLGILDVSNPAAPMLQGALKTPGQAKSVAVFKTQALVSDHMSGVDHIDISNPAKPVSLGSFFLDGYSRDVAASGHMAYAVDAPTGVYVFDLSKPGPLDAVSSQQTATAPGSIELSDPSAAEGPQIAVLLGGGLLQVYDLSNPMAPVKAGTHKTSGVRSSRVTLKGKVAYVPDLADGMQVVDLSRPATPRVIATYKTASPVRDVAVAGPLVYVVVGPPAHGNIPAGGGEVLILRETRTGSQE
jgi:hypothetical protein